MPWLGRVMSPIPGTMPSQGSRATGPIRLSFAPLFPARRHVPAVTAFRER